MQEHRLATPSNGERNVVDSDIKRDSHLTSFKVFSTHSTIDAIYHDLIAERIADKLSPFSASTAAEFMNWSFLEVYWLLQRKYFIGRGNRFHSAKQERMWWTLCISMHGNAYSQLSVRFRAFRCESGEYLVFKSINTLWQVFRDKF